jgi:hypothetical protein
MARSVARSPLSALSGYSATGRTMSRASANGGAYAERGERSALNVIKSSRIAERLADVGAGRASRPIVAEGEACVFAVRAQRLTAGGHGDVAASKGNADNLTMSTAPVEDISTYSIACGVIRTLQGPSEGGLKSSAARLPRSFCFFGAEKGQCHQPLSVFADRRAAA